MQGCAVPEIVPVPRFDAVHADSAKTMAASDRRTGAATRTILLMIVGRYDGRNGFAAAKMRGNWISAEARDLRHSGREAAVPICGYLSRHSAG